MASPQMLWNLSKSFFERNNPLEELVKIITDTMDNVMTFNSRMKLLRYKFYLAQQQLDKMEENLEKDNPFNLKGYKIDRDY